MQTQRAPRLQRTLTLAIAFALVIVGLCMYKYLVRVFEDHWPRYCPPHLRAEGWSSATCVYHARWAPIMESQPVLGGPGHHPETFMPEGDDDIEPLVRLLLSQGRHASGVMYCAGPAESACAVADDIEVEAFHESEEAPQPDTRTICALRRSQGRYDIGVFVIQGHPCGARDNITLNDPVEQAHPRRVTSRIVGRNIHLVREGVE